jgi:hypothetical protein
MKRTMIKKNRIKTCISGLCLALIAVFLCPSVSSAATGPVLDIPEAAGSIAQRYNGSSDATLILIEDHHASMTAQVNTITLIDTIFRQFKDAGALARLYIEGATGEYRLERLRAFPFSAEKKRVMFDKLQSGFFLAGECAQVLTEEEFTLYGLEDETIFFEAHQEFYRIGREHTAIYRGLERVRERLQRLKDTYYNEGLRAFDREALRYEKKELPFGRYLPTLFEHLDQLQIDYAQFLILLQIRNALVLESQIHFPSLDREIETLAGALTEPFSEVAERYQKYRSGEIDQKEIAIYLYGKAIQKKLPLDAYFNLPNAVTLWRSIGRIDEHARDREIHVAGRAIRQALARADTEKKIIRLSAAVAEIEQLLFFSAPQKVVLDFLSAPRKYSLVAIEKEITALEGGATGLRGAVDIEPFLQSARTYYTAAIKREDMIASALIEKARVSDKPYLAVVIGADHIPALAERFQAAGTSYISVRPAGYLGGRDVQYMERLLGFRCPVRWPHGAAPRDSFNASIALLNRAYFTELIAQTHTDMEISLLMGPDGKVLRPDAVENKLTGYMTELKERASLSPAEIDQWQRSGKALVAVSREITSGALVARLARQSGSGSFSARMGRTGVELDNRLIAEALARDKTLVDYFAALNEAAERAPSEDLDWNLIREDFAAIEKLGEAGPLPAILLHPDITAEERGLIAQFCRSRDLAIIDSSGSQASDSGTVYFYVGIEPLEREFAALEGYSVSATVFVGRRADRRARYITYFDVLFLALATAAQDPLTEIAEPEKYFKSAV